MPCFKGIAVSVHAEGAPLPEYSVQKQSRVSRVNTYIPVPQAKISREASSNKPEPSKFAISITLLTPSLPIPYSTPKPTPSNPYPRPHITGSLPSSTGERGQFNGLVGPYIPLTKSENETIAAYIYFDGRPKEEVATLLRPGEETWVNSRWVNVPDSEGGGLAEREFLFREVGLERWLNGLDLDGKDAAAKIERRRQKFEKRRRRRKTQDASDDEAGGPSTEKMAGLGDVLRYGDNEKAPVEKLSDNDESLDSDSDDDDAPPEAAGQIKVAMFRVLASGEIKRGEYSPQFDAHDDDEGSEEGGKKNGKSDEGDADHTTSFAKPKTLDPKTISTQTVTGIDGPDKPYAVFTFFYRGERQLQKMGILESAKTPKTTAVSAKRRSTQVDFSNLAPLQSGGAVGFSTFRDQESSSARQTKARKTSSDVLGDAMAEDSDEDDDATEVVGKMDEIDEKEVRTLLSPEDARQQGEIADGVGRIKLKRQHSAEPLSEKARKSPLNPGTPVLEGSGPDLAPAQPIDLPKTAFSPSVPEEGVVGSPMKKHRASVYDNNHAEMQQFLKTGIPAPMGDVLSMAEASQGSRTLSNGNVKIEDEEEL